MTKRNVLKILVQASRFFLAALWLFAAGAKIYMRNDPTHSFFKNMNELVGNSLAQPLAVAIICAEIIAAILLLSAERGFAEAALTRGPAMRSLQAVALALGAFFFAGALARGGYAAWPGFPAGVACALVAGITAGLLWDWVSPAAPFVLGAATAAAAAVLLAATHPTAKAELVTNPE